MEYSLDYDRAADPTGLLPIIDVSAPSNVTKQASVSVLIFKGTFQCFVGHTLSK